MILTALVFTAVLAQTVETRTILFEGEPEFKPSATFVPPNYKGSDIKEIYRALSIAPKDEFETTAQYEARKSKIPSGIYAFRIPTMLATYDADAGQFTAKYIVDFAHRGRESREGGMIPLAEERKGTSSRQASNAFGATVTVQTSKTHTWGITVPETRFIIVDLKFPVPVEKARAIKDRIGALVVASIGPESVPERMASDPDPEAHDATGFYYKEPKIDSPSEVWSYEHVIDAKILAVWAYDTESGEVLGKFDALGRPVDAAGNAIEQPKPKPKLPPVTSPGTLMVSTEIGMTIDEVRQLAAPLKAPKITKKGNIEEWKFSDGYLFRFKDGKLDNIRTPSKFWLRDEK